MLRRSGGSGPHRGLRCGIPGGSRWACLRLPLGHRRGPERRTVAARAAGVACAGAGAVPWGLSVRPPGAGSAPRRDRPAPVLSARKSSLGRMARGPRTDGSGSTRPGATWWNDHRPCKYRAGRPQHLHPPLPSVWPGSALRCSDHTFLSDAPARRLAGVSYARLRSLRRSRGPYLPFPGSPTRAPTDRPGRLDGVQPGRGALAQPGRDPGDQHVGEGHAARDAVEGADALGRDEEGLGRPRHKRRQGAVGDRDDGGALLARPSAASATSDRS